ncbi:MAG TPA: histidine kinase dimerization/phospho-acceptor domain-containing protein [Vicinamibacterales bacterium]|nr:histidine kinase dimerization/phospho-acceptor domain-containing protein [Vicinamibacterales bacterium]
MTQILDRPDDVSVRRRSRWWFVAIAVSVCMISALHYVTSYHSVPLHEVFQRLYYLPIVVAAVIYGARGGLAVAGLSAVLFLPHVIFNWHAWPAMQTGQYAEIVVFVLVGSVTGLLADRLRAQRDRCQRTAVQLDDTCRRLEASIEERLRADRLVTIGRVASGIAHEIRNPLGGLLGSLEILGADVPQGHPKTEFLAIAKHQIERLNRVVTDFLDFARPPLPATRPADLGTVVEAVVRLAEPALALRGATLHMDTAKATPAAAVDVDQVERALLNLLLDETAVPHDACFEIAVDHSDRSALVVVSRPTSASGPGRSVTELFEPFHESGQSAGLALATARRLIENQRGTIRAELAPGCLRYVIELPLASANSAATNAVEDVDTSPTAQAPLDERV